MRAETRARVEAFRQALELAAGERSGEPIPAHWRGYLADFPRGCCELASQTLVKYLRDHDKKLFPYVIATDWIENAVERGHVFVALDGEYIDLTLDQFDGYDDWIEAEPIESDGKLAAFLQNVRKNNGSVTTRKVTLAVINNELPVLYAWLKRTANGLLAAAGQNVKPGRSAVLVSRDIHPDYRDWSNTPSSPSVDSRGSKGK